MSTKWIIFDAMGVIFEVGDDTNDLLVPYIQNKNNMISAETKHEEKKEENSYVYRERRSGSYYRAISLPSPVDPDSSKASYENGVLEIKMPKTEIKKKKPPKID